MSVTNKLDCTFKPDDYVVYPTHGVGKVLNIEQTVVAGHEVELVVVSFEHEKMILRVPTYKVQSSGMRPLANDTDIEEALNILKGRPRIRRIMWSRRAQEYEAKINSGSLVCIAEVIRDLYKGASNTEQSYSERQLFESAFDRFAMEMAAISQMSKSEAEAIINARLDQKKVIPTNVEAA